MENGLPAGSVFSRNPSLEEEDVDDETSTYFSAASESLESTDVIVLETPVGNSTALPLSLVMNIRTFKSTDPVALARLSTSSSSLAHCKSLSLRIAQTNPSFRVGLEA